MSGPCCEPSDCCQSEHELAEHELAEHELAEHELAEHELAEHEREGLKHGDHKSQQPVPHTSATMPIANGLLLKPRIVPT